MNRAFIRRLEVLERYGISNSTLYQWIQNGKFPAPIKMIEGGAAAAWLSAELDEFDAKRISAARGAEGAN